jgi:hypothetical protein
MTADRPNGAVPNNLSSNTQASLSLVMCTERNCIRLETAMMLIHALITRVQRFGNILYSCSVMVLMIRLLSWRPSIPPQS